MANSAPNLSQIKALAQPRVSYVGPVAAWWIPKPRGPRISLRSLAKWCLGIVPITAATILWILVEGRSMWPFGRHVSTLPEILLRYEITFWVFIAYVVMGSLPAWFRYRRLAKRDALAIDQAIREEQWERAALYVHRYCLLVSAVWHRVPARVAAWDSVLRKRLPRHRRLYIYYRDPAPELPSDATASFTPAIVPPPQPSLWSAVALIPVAFLLYLLILDIQQRGHWQRLLLVNASLLLVILLLYSTYFLMRLLGRSYYFRFAPGVAQLIRFNLGRRKPVIETFDLRQKHAVLDLSTPWLAFTLLDVAGTRRETFRLPKTREAVEAILRATLSTAPSPPLPDDLLID